MIQHHRSKYIPASKHLFDGKFNRSFNVAMALTVRALTIQGVSAAIIAETQTSLCQYQLQHSKPDSEDRGDSSATESVPSSKHIRDLVLPIRSNRSVDLPQRSPKARDYQLAKTTVAPTILLFSKHSRRDAVAPLRTKSLRMTPLPKLNCGHSGLHFVIHLPRDTLFPAD